MGPTRRSLAPTANTSPHPPPQRKRDSSTTLRATPPAQRLLARVTRCGHPRIATRPQQTTPPAPTRETRRSMSTRDNWAQQPTTADWRAKTNNSRRVPKDSPGAPIGTQWVASPGGPPPRLRSRHRVNHYQANRPRVTPSAPVGTEQLVRSHPSWVVSFFRRGGGVFPRNPSPT